MTNNTEKILLSLQEEPKLMEQLMILFPLLDVAELLSEMESQGLVFESKNGFYMTIEDAGLIVGTLRTNEKGFGFVERSDGKGDDIFVSEQETNGSLHGDKVLVKMKKGTSKQNEEGRIVKTLQMQVSSFVGTFYESGDMSFVKPDDKKLKIHTLIQKKNQKSAVAGHKVLVNLVNYNPETRRGDGEVLEILGHKNDPGVDILSIIHENGINIEFNEDTLEQANNINEVVPLDEVLKRRDLRNEFIITIDGEDAKDLDDAVSVKKLDNERYKLGVHIADVSHYVTENSPLDIEAFERGTSVYLVDRVIPMLPHRLSNGICSLNPNVDRLTLSCEMIFDNEGNLLEYELFESVINTTERMTYTDVRKILLREDEAVLKKYKEWIRHIDTMGDLSNILRTRRFNQGAIDFEVKESKIVLNEEGKTADIVFRERSVAEKLIEDFMLAANETVASHFMKKNKPFVYRIHDKPHAERVSIFANFASNFGHRFEKNGDTIDSKVLQEILESTKDTEEGAVISRLALRTMKQAKYTPDNIGHYGLAMDNYTHFTSPIRRYPDLIVHRLVKEDISNQAIQNDIGETSTMQHLVAITEHSSERERRAVKTERATLELKKAEFMLDKVGEEFVGIVSSVTKFGFFVELDNTVEGLIHIQSLDDDHYLYDEKSMGLIGKKNKTRYTIGDKMKVKLVNVDMDQHVINFQVLKKHKSHTHTRNIKGKSNRKDSSSKYKNRFDRLYE